LVELLTRAKQRLDELHVDLDPVARQGLLVALPAILVPLVALRTRQPVHVEALEDVPDSGRADRDDAIALQVHRDPQGPEVAVLAQGDDLSDHLYLRGPRGILSGLEEPFRRPFSPNSS
jgi:hypothetical protein